ncbi:DEAD/DEAH box helicase, partial [Cooperia oncophora]
LRKQLEGLKKAKLDVVTPEVGAKTFNDFEIDERLLKAIGNMGWKWPTQVQESIFGLALEDKNILARARTGSGKTGAYLIPIINKAIGYVATVSGESKGPFALFIAPTKELCVQINDLLLKLLQPLPFLRSLNLADLTSDERSVWENGLKKAKLDVVTPEVGAKTFNDFEIDERLLKAIGNMGWKWPTQVQESIFGLALEDKNILGSESAESINDLLLKLLQPFAGFFAISETLADLLADERIWCWGNDTANFVVSTPGKILEVLAVRRHFCEDVRHLVLDEADLLLSFGYEDEMSSLKKFLPVKYQCILTSATITDDMSTLKTLFMTGPVLTLKLKEGDLPDVDQLTQYQITCLDDNERFAILVAMFKLRLIVGKTIIFVNDTNRCYM